jgi:hypothetical protein
LISTCPLARCDIGSHRTNVSLQDQGGSDIVSMEELPALLSGSQQAYDSGFRLDDQVWDYMASL